MIVEHVNRSMMYRRGFGDGAKSSAYKHPDDADYMAGWRHGADRVRIAVIRFEAAHGLDVDHSPLREEK